MTRVMVDRLLLVVVVTGLLLAVSAIGGAGVSTSLWGIRISSRTFFRPFAISVAAALIALHLFEHRAHQMAKLWAAVDRRATTIAVCLSLVSVALAYRFSAFEANAAINMAMSVRRRCGRRGISHFPSLLLRRLRGRTRSGRSRLLGIAPG